MFNPLPESTVELSESGTRFLTDLFNRYDKDGDQALSPTEQEDLFSICPEFMWDDLISHTVDTNNKGWVTLEGFLAFWTLQTNLDYTCTTSFLAHVGYSVIEKGGLASAVREVQPRGHEKSVFRCRVMGGRGCGKTTFCRSLISKMKDVTKDGDEDEVICIKSVTSANRRIYLVLHESSYDPLEHFDDNTLVVGSLLEGYDVVCLLFDSSERASFQSAVQLFNAIDSTISEVIPCVFIATKTDLPTVEQVGELQPNEFCHDVDLPPPLSVCLPLPDSYTQAYARLAAVSLDPSQNLPSSFRIPRWLKMASLGVLVTAGLGSLLVFLLVRMRRSGGNRFSL
ncbi:PREDICTED: mitochondrial Rho GTPase 1-A-like [Amphimedon queenslandica]|nr:PREDICTED: mitochondrial Rho GTPase 1-A-like [Amphimedon queenslandica]|eukprot:XP_003388429.2 PREDICTED: mitochondrial Rho GTPase 1-A-like [Amphimedon queenslandica]